MELDSSLFTYATVYNYAHIIIASHRLFPQLLRLRPNVIGFAKTIPNGTRTESNLQLNINATLQHYPHTPNIRMAIDGKVCFLRWHFADPVKPRRCITVAVKTVNSINKEMCGAKLLPATVSAYPVDCVCFNDSLKTQHCYLSYNGRYNPSPVAYPHPPP